MLIGCDFHPSWQQVCWVDTETGETEEHKLVHAPGEAEKFYRQFAAPALIGMESTGNCQWFVEMATAAGHEVWIGDAAKIRASDVRQQKHDQRDAALLLQLLVEGRFPRIWTPSGQQRDLRQLLIHRHKLVRLRANVKNGLQHLAMNQGVQKKRRLWSAAGQKLLRELPLSAVGQPAARRPVECDGDARPAGAVVGPGGAGSSRARSKRAAADDPAGSGTGHVDGVRADDGRCLAVSARQAGGQLSGTDSAGVQFWRTSAAGIDQQAGQQVFANAVGGSGAGSGALRSGISERVFASLPQQAERSGESGGGEEVGDSTLLDAAHAISRIRRSFVSRAARGCPWSAQARPKD